jgi:hypothetical protein
MHPQDEVDPSALPSGFDRKLGNFEHPSRALALIQSLCHAKHLVLERIPLPVHRVGEPLDTGVFGGGLGHNLCSVRQTRAMVIL